MVEWTHTFCSQHILDFSEANPTANIKKSTWGFQRAFFPARFTQTLVSKECADLASALVCAKVCSLCILSPSIYTHKNAGFHETARLAKNVRIKKYICKPGLSRKVAQLKLQVYIYIYRSCCWNLSFVSLITRLVYSVGFSGPWFLFLCRADLILGLCGLP